MNAGTKIDRRARALDLLGKLEPEAPRKVAENLDSFGPNITESILGFAFADVLSRPAIDLRTREMLTVAALTAMGTTQSQLEFHIRAALNVGVSREEVAEIILQMAVYAGVPAFMNGVAAARKVFDEDESRPAGAA